ncbi:MAG: chloride channel protein [Planctomycetia bacterium]|nr:MAG: chloride channel protein [Planctomycetia bacterium]RIK70906.1 MAG: hypothetical protein DCC66_03265 [Planctomycetota bacterium]
MPLPRINALWSRFRQPLPKPAARWSRLFALGVLVGVLGGLAAAAFEWSLHHATLFLIGRVTHLGSPEVLRFDWRVLVLPAVGGMISGLLVKWFCPQSARGHGTDALIRAFHHHQGVLPLRGPAVKAVANVAVLSCGGSTGPEGPNAALGASIGSAVGVVFRLAPRERRAMLIAGCAAAVGAIFRCPLGGALFATSVLYQEEEFESDAIVPSFVASVLGYSVFMTLWGGLGQPEYLIRGADQLAFGSIQDLLAYAALGPLCGLGAILFTRTLRLVEDTIMPRVRLPLWITPAVGGLATGTIACVFPQVMDGRYAFIQGAVDGMTKTDVSAGAWAGLLALIIVFKCLATATTVGSGGSGGALGPSVFLGGVIGAFLGAMIDAIDPGMMGSSSGLRPALVAVGMGGVLAATMRTPLASIVMVTEMTGGFGLIVPLMLVCVSAYVIGRKWGLSREQVRTSVQSPAHAGDAIVRLLESWRVDEIMDRVWPETISPGATLREIVSRLTPGTRPVFAVAEGGELLGLISTTDIQRIMNEPALAEAIIAADMMTRRLVTVQADDDVYSSLDAFRRSDHDVLPVLTAPPERRWIGMLSRRRVLEAVRDHMAGVQRLMFREHAGLRTMEEDARLEQLGLGIAPARRDLVQRLTVPSDAVGRSLRETDFRRAHGAQVIAIEQPDGSLQCPPNLDAPLEADQRLLVVTADGGVRRDSEKG